MVEDASNNPYLAMFTNNCIMEKRREMEEKATGIKALKTILFEQEKIKKRGERGELTPEQRELFSVSQVP